MTKIIDTKVRSSVNDPKLSKKLIDVWGHLYRQLHKLDYQYDRLVWVTSLEFADFAVLIGGPDDPHCHESPFQLTFHVEGIDVELDSDDEVHKYVRFLSKTVPVWARHAIKESWNNKKTQKLYQGLQLPTGKLGIYSTEFHNATRAEDLKWLCGNRLKFAETGDELPFLLRKFCADFNGSVPGECFFAKKGKISEIIFGCPLVFSEIDRKFLKRLEPVARQILAHGHRPKKVVFTEQTVTKDIEKQISKMFNNCKITYQSEERYDEFAEDLEHAIVTDEYVWIDGTNGQNRL